MPERKLKVFVSKPATMVVMALISVAVLAGAGFGFGWFLSGEQVRSLSAIDGPSPTTTVSEPETTLPDSDVDGEDLAALPRYPGSVRVAYSASSVRSGGTLTKASYETDAQRAEVKDFYRGVFRSGEWTVEDLEFSNGEWSFLVVDGERQAHVEIEPEGKKIVRISIRLEAAGQEQREPTNPNNEPNDEDDEAAPPATTGSAGGQAAPPPGSPDYAPLDDDEGYEEDDYYDDYEDDYDGSEVPEVPDDSEDD